MITLRSPLITELSYPSNSFNSGLIIQGLPSVTSERVIVRLFSRIWGQFAYEQFMLSLMKFCLEQIDTPLMLIRERTER